MENTQSVVAAFTAILDHDGLHAGLAFLNARTRHRYTGVYRFDPPMLRSVCLYDRENPAVRVSSDSPMLETYCSIVGDRALVFSTPDSLGDDALSGHPARFNVQAYCGAPVIDDSGSCVGSLCHWDPRPRLVPESEIPVLERIGKLISAACTSARSSALAPS